EHMERIGVGAPEPNASRVVLGAGTGLGVPVLVLALGRWIPAPGEGGLMDLLPRTPRAFEVLPHIQKIEGPISGEHILCGGGLLNVYRAVAMADGKPVHLDDPAEVAAAALAGTDPIAVGALCLFVTCLGRTAGDLALVFMSRGGVFLTGGIVQKIVP